MTTPLSIVTLGPPGTNHEFVTRKYLAFQGLPAEALTLAASTEEAVSVLREGAAEYLVICAVHPDTPRVVGGSFRELFIVDTFVSPSLPLAVLTRREVARPRSIGVLHPSTTDYVDSERWEQVVRFTTGTLHDVGQALLRGEIESGLVYQRLADEYPERLRVDEVIGSPDDAWLVLGRERAYRDPLLAWPDSPVAQRIRAARASPSA